MTDQFVYLVGWLHITAYGLLAFGLLGLGCMYAGVRILEGILRHKAIYAEFVAFIQARVKTNPETYRRYWK